MKKEKCVVSWILLAALLGVLCTGCADRILDEIPRDFAFVFQEKMEEQDTPQGEAAQNAEAHSGLVPQDALEEAAETQSDETAASFLMEETFYYGCSILSEAEQIWYHDIERTLGGFGEKADLSEAGLAAGLDESCIDRIFQCVMGDHPELFYVEGYSYTKYMRGDRLIGIDFSGTYSISLESALARQDEITASADRILAGIDEQASDYEKVKYVYETLIRETDYSLDAPDNQNLYSVFVNHLSVCQGYAKATQYLLNRLGIPCTLVLGKVDTGEGHAWNLVQIEGEYYYVDTTWGDVSYQSEGSMSREEIASAPEINYDYLNVTTEELLRTHSVDGTIPLPLCQATEANYYVMEGALLVSYDREQIAGLFERAKESGQEAVVIKCVDAACYEEVVNAMIEEQEVFQYLEAGESSVAYTKNENQLSLTFWVTSE